MKSGRTTGILAAAFILLIPVVSQSAIINFGSGTNSFQMEFVSIGNPGNAADTTGQPNPAGSVGYAYGIAKFEVSEDMITKYNAIFGTSNSLAITKNNRGANKPATGISWNEAARFVNWLNQSTGGFAAYNFTTSGVNDNITPWTALDTLDYDPSNPFRSRRATFVLPTYNEWYKAAYYDPNKSGTDKYWDHATGSNASPTSVTSGTASGSAVYGQTLAQGPADVDQAGGLSKYGVMGLGGNAAEWDESTSDLSSGNYNANGTANRGFRGGAWDSNAGVLKATFRDNNTPTTESQRIGFRVVRLEPVPEPSMMIIGTLFGLGGMMAKRRKSK